MISTIHLRRTGETISRFGKQGCRGVLLVGDQTLYTLERGNGYKWLRPGIFTLEIAHMGNGAPALRVLGDYSRGDHPVGRMYVHAATRARHLKGCVAAALSQHRHGLAQSKPAMAVIFDALGGFRVGTKCRLTVTGEIS